MPRYIREVYNIKYKIKNYINNELENKVKHKVIKKQKALSSKLKKI